METFKIEIKETLSRVVEVKAESATVACDLVQKMYRKEEIVLDADDYLQTDFIKLND